MTRERMQKLHTEAEEYARRAEGNARWDRLHGCRAEEAKWLDLAERWRRRAEAWRVLLGAA